MYKFYLTPLGMDIVRSYKETDILYEIMPSMFSMVSYTLYNLFNTIRFITINLSIKLYDDGAFEAGCEYPDKSINRNTEIRDLNSLFQYLFIRKGIIDSLDIYIERLGWFYTMEKIENLTVFFKDGSVKKYDFNDFIEIYNLFK